MQVPAAVLVVTAHVLQVSRLCTVGQVQVVVVSVLHRGGRADRLAGHCSVILVLGQVKLVDVRAGDGRRVHLEIMDIVRIELAQYTEQYIV